MSNTLGTRSCDNDFEKERIHWENVYTALSDADLILSFNSSTKIPAWNTVRAAQMAAMRAAFTRREWDWSAIGDETSLSLRYCVVLVGKKIHRFSSVDFAHVALILATHLRQKQGLHLSPELIAYDDERLVYGLKGEKEVFRVTTKELIMCLGTVVDLPMLKSGKKYF